MKKYLEIAVGVMAVVAAGAAQAQTAVCTGGTATTATRIDGVATNFVQVTFTGRCSNNVHLQYMQNTTAFAVGSASSKGKTVFMGNTAGGGVSPQTGVTCPATGCTAGLAGTAASSALTAAASS